MNKTRVYVDATSLATDKLSGIQHTALEISKALARQGGVEIVLLAPLGTRNIIKKHDTGLLTVRTIPFSKKMLSLIARTRFAPAMDIFIGKGTYLFPDYRNWPLAFSKSITYIHDAAFYLYPETLAPKNLSYIRKNINLWTGRTDLVVTVSQSSKKDLEKALNISPEKIKVVYNGIDPDFYKKKPTKEIQNIKSKYKIKNDYLLHVGNFEPRKNIPLLVNAYIQISHKINKKI